MHLQRVSQPSLMSLRACFAGVSAFLFTPDELQTAPVTPKTVQLFGCVSERARQLMLGSAHAHDAQVVQFTLSLHFRVPLSFR